MNNISAETTYSTRSETKTGIDVKLVPKMTPCHHSYKTATDETLGVVQQYS